MHLLAGQPAWWAWLRADPAGRAGQLAEEALRYLSPVRAGVLAEAGAGICLGCRRRGSARRTDRGVWHGGSLRM
jgi:hypothetical protein